MSDIIRSGGVGRGALLMVVLIGSLTVCLGQEQPATPPAASAQDAKPEAAKSEAAKPDAATQDVTKAGTPSAAEPSPAKPSKGKRKKGKEPVGPGEVAFNGVQDKPYEIGPEDILFLNVLHQQDVSGTLAVRPDGYVSVRFAGEVKAAGLTSQQLSDSIADRLTKYFNHPEVNIQVVKINSKKYYISGEVRKPGAYGLTSPKTIYEALIEAGGLADFAKKSKIYLLRGQQRIPFNYNDVSKGKKLEQNILLQNGDVVVVP